MKCVSSELLRACFIIFRECNVSVNDTVDSLYNNFMYPEGVKAMGEAVQVDNHYSHHSYRDFCDR